MSQPIVCVLLGFAISLAVNALKSVPFVKNNPVVVASVISILLSLLQQVHLSGGIFSAFNPIDLIVCFLTQLSTAVATHEVAIKPAAQRLVNTNPPAPTRPPDVVIPGGVATTPSSLLK
jgi:hypothetical protein